MSSLFIKSFWFDLIHFDQHDVLKLCCLILMLTWELSRPRKTMLVSTTYKSPVCLSVCCYLDMRKGANLVHRKLWPKMWMFLTRLIRIWTKNPNCIKYIQKILIPSQEKIKFFHNIPRNDYLNGSYRGPYFRKIDK